VDGTTTDAPTPVHQTSATKKLAAGARQERAAGARQAEYNEANPSGTYTNEAPTQLTT